MKKPIKKLVAGLVIVAGLSGTYLARAAADGDWAFPRWNAGTSSYDTIPVYPRNTSLPAMLGGEIGSTDARWYEPDNGLIAYLVSDGLGGTKYLLDVDPSEILITDLGGATAAFNAKANTSTVNSLSSTVSSHTTSISTFNSLMTQINNNLTGSATNMLAQTASPSAAGLMTKAQSDKLSNLPAMQAWSWSTPTRSIVTGTGATGFQPSSTRMSTVRYNVKVSTTATIGGASDGYVTLETAATNSATAGDWVEIGRCGNSQNISLAVVLQSVQTVTCQISADVPAGYYVKLRSVNTAGTPTYTFISSSEVLK